MPDSAQLFLLPWENPLRARVGSEFFRELPASAGVYLMVSVEAEVLYIGKSKNLRSRVASYASVHPARSARKFCRLVHQIAAIQIRETADEAAALRLETELIRQYRPKFNAASTHPESNVFWGLRLTPDCCLETRWTRREQELSEWETSWTVHGAFRSPAGTAALTAVRRLLWWRMGRDAEWSHWPRTLLLAKPPGEFSQPFAKDTERKRWERKLDAWLATGDPAFLHRLGGKNGPLLQAIPHAFLRSLLLRDFDCLQHFGEARARADNTHPFRHAVRKRGYLAQAQLDDLANLRSHSDRTGTQTRLL